MDVSLTDKASLARRERAIVGVKMAVRDLQAVGVEAQVIGSLAKGTFGAHSDVDLLIVSCPSDLKYAIESTVEDHLDGLPFDVIYLDEIPLQRLAKFAEGAIDARHLR